MKRVEIILRLALAAVFVAAAVPKIADPAAFHDAILSYRLLPASLSAAVALWLPWLELCTGLALLWPRHRAAALGLMLALTVVFLAALGQAAWRELDIVCGCFGRPASVRGAAYLEYLGRDLALLLVTVWLLLRERNTHTAAGR
ncbi:MAG TPA: MauE/DoxX family redox-associated membrane protein [Opitutaceae bacterium]|nr:MauE/DoxX family redox-associated membrane protein [Opitutaceae bacterium]